MPSDISAVLWKEWREVLRMGSSKTRAVLRLVFSVAILGVLWPWQLGPPFVTSRLAVLLAAFTASMYVAGVVPDSFAGERERHTLETLLASRLPDRAILFGKIAALMTYGLGAAAVMLLFGWITVNVIHAKNEILLYDVWTLLGATAFSILAAGLMGAVGVLVSLRAATVKQAQQVLTTAVLILLFLPIIVIPMIPGEWHRAVAFFIDKRGMGALAAAAAVLLAIVQIVLYAIAIARFKRARLILEQ